MRSALVTIALGLLVLAAGTGVIWQAGETMSLRREISNLSESANDLGRMRAEHRRLQTQLEQALAEKRKSTISRAPVLPPRAETTASPAFVSPALQAEVEERYAVFFARLTLPPEIKQSIARSIAARHANLAEQARAATRAGQSPHATELLARAYETQIQLGAQLEAEFGLRVAEAYRQFEWELAARNVVVIATKRLASTPTPLTEDQGRRLFTLMLTQAGPELPGDVSLSYFLPPYSQSIEITERTLQAAAPWLSPAQLAVLDMLRLSQQKAAR